VLVEYEAVHIPKGNSCCNTQCAILEEQCSAQGYCSAKNFGLSQGEFSLAVSHASGRMGHHTLRLPLGSQGNPLLQKIAAK